MRVLYAVQGTGNGHISRAAEIIPALMKRVEVDVLISGMHTELELGFPVKYRLHGLGFKFGKSGGVDYFNTWWQGDFPRFIREIKTLDLSAYDLVINDFEPVSAHAARKQHVPCVGLSNQCVLLDPRIPKPKLKKHKLALAVLKRYAPVDSAYGFHYSVFDHFVFTPIIRREIRNLEIKDEGYYVVYLPAYNDRKIIKFLGRFGKWKFVVFSKHSTHAYSEANCEINPIKNKDFINALGSAKGIICGAGFATTSEALYLGKKLLVVPMKNQFEQLCNAEGLKYFGIPVLKNLKAKNSNLFRSWLKTDVTVEVKYPDITAKIADSILADFAAQNAVYHEAIYQSLFEPLS